MLPGDRIVDHSENNWDRHRCLLERREIRRSLRENDVGCELDQFSRVGAHARNLATGPAPLDPEVSPFGPAKIGEVLPQRHGTRLAR